MIKRFALNWQQLQDGKKAGRSKGKGHGSRSSFLGVRWENGAELRTLGCKSDSLSAPAGMAKEIWGQEMGWKVQRSKPVGFSWGKALVPLPQFKSSVARTSKSSPPGRAAVEFLADSSKEETQMGSNTL